MIATESSVCSMQQSKHRLPMSESPDAAAVLSKRRRVDLGMPRGVLSLSGKGDSMLNGADEIMDSANATDMLRKMLHKHSKVVPDVAKNGHGDFEEAKTGDYDDSDRISVPNGTSDKANVDEKSSDETEAMESGTDDGSESNKKTSVDDENGDCEENRDCNGYTSPPPSSTKDDLKAKRARVENIITSMRKSPTPHSNDQIAADALEAKRQKRKQYQPQQQRAKKPATESSGNERANGRRHERRKLKDLLGHLQQQLDVLQEKYFDLYEEDNSSLSDDGSDDLDDLKEPIETLSAIRKCEKQARAQAKKRAAAENAALMGKGGSVRLRDTLKKELARSVYSTVDTIVEDFASKHVENQYSTSAATPEIADTVPVLQFPNNPQQKSPGAGSRGSSTRQTTPHRFDEEQTEAISLVVPNRSRVATTKASPSSERSRTSSPAASTTSQQLAAAEAITAGEMMRHPFMPAFLPTSVAIPNPSLHPFSAMSLVSAAGAENGAKKEQKDAFEEMSSKWLHDRTRQASMEISRGYSSSPLLSYPHPFLHHGAMAPSEHTNSSPDTTPVSAPEHHLSSPLASYTSQIKMETERAAAGLVGRGSPNLSEYSAPNGTSLLNTLTPTHLRKAKLMFFFTRYPSSALLRQHFPDVQFNRHNTSQIIKWFSNFREFYYIQMEKFARQAASDGVEDSEGLVVTRDSELFRVLSLHYNKSNDFHVPDGFLQVSTTTLREFFEAIKLGKDAEPSWKKTIYKVIGKLDEMLPEFFKSPTCLEDLE